MTFQKKAVVLHLKTGRHYVIMLTPEDGLTMEETGTPAYAYQAHDPGEDSRIWVRSQAEMEDGRFIPEIQALQEAKNDIVALLKRWKAQNLSRVVHLKTAATLKASMGEIKTTVRKNIKLIKSVKRIQEDHDRKTETGE